MNKIATENQQQIAADVPEGTRNPCLDALLHGWPRLAAFAWGAYRQHGRGAVVVTPSQPLGLIYVPAVSCTAPDGVLANYDPEAQAVVGVGRCPVHVAWLGALGGFPTPLEAWRTLPAEVVGETVQ